MIGEDIKTEVSLEELRKITWDYSKEDIIGLYQGEVVRGFLWDATECGDVNHFSITRCNVAEGWVEHIECDEPGKIAHNISQANIKRGADGQAIRTIVSCKVVIDLLDAEGNVIVTLR